MASQPPGLMISGSLARHCAGSGRRSMRFAIRTKSKVPRSEGRSQASPLGEADIFTAQIVRQRELQFVTHRTFTRHANRDAALAAHTFGLGDEARRKINAKHVVEMPRELEAAAADGAAEIERAAAPAQFDVAKRLADAARRESAGRMSLGQQRADLLGRAVVEKDVLRDRVVGFVEVGAHDQFPMPSMVFSS